MCEGLESLFTRMLTFLDDFSVNARNADILLLISFSMILRVVLVDSIFFSWL